MDDQDLINLQRLVRRGSQPSPSNNGPPYSIQMAQALDAMSAGRLPINPNADKQRQTLAHAILTYGQPEAYWSTELASEPNLATHSVRQSATDDLATASNSTQIANGDVIPVVDKNRRKECMDICSDLALPTRDNGTSFRRCVATCVGEADWPEWKKYFPNRRDELQQSSPPVPQQPQQSAQPPWWLPLLPLLIRIAPAAAAAA